MDMTLGLIMEEGKILLGMKKRGFGEGRWNGFGGKVKTGETIEEAMIREFVEESGISVISHEKVGKIEFEFKGNPEIFRVHLFKIKEYSGEPKESEEMKPHWFDVDKIPFGDMWPDDKIWMPMVLDGKKFTGRFLFDGEDKIIRHELKESSDL